MNTQAQRPLPDYAVKPRIVYVIYAWHWDIDQWTQPWIQGDGYSSFEEANNYAASLKTLYGSRRHYRVFKREIKDTIPIERKRCAICGTWFDHTLGLTDDCPNCQPGGRDDRDRWGDGSKALDPNDDLEPKEHDEE